MSTPYNSSRNISTESTSCDPCFLRTVIYKSRDQIVRLILINIDINVNVIVIAIAIVIAIVIVIVIVIVIIVIVIVIAKVIVNAIN